MLVGVGGIGVSVQVAVGVKVAVGGTGVKVADGGTGVKVAVGGTGVVDGVQVGGMNWVGVMVGVPLGVGVAVLVKVRLGVKVFSTGVTEKLSVEVGERVNVGVTSTFPPLGATMIATRPTQYNGMVARMMMIRMTRRRARGSEGRFTVINISSVCKRSKQLR